jgi:hypothetical protein
MLKNEENKVLPLAKDLQKEVICCEFVNLFSTINRIILNLVFGFTKAIEKV